MTDKIITVVRDPNNYFGKKITKSDDGKVKKESRVRASEMIAIQLQVENHDQFSQLLQEVGENPNAAITNAGFKGIPVGEEFYILSGTQVEEELGIPKKDREKQLGLHEIERNGKTFKAVCRYKENMTPSAWQFLDRDIDQHTPSEHAQKTNEEWLADLNTVISGLDGVTKIITLSASARVHDDGESVSNSSGHVWFLVDNSEDIARFRVASMAQAVLGGLAWSKPRHSRLNPGEIVGNSIAYTFDPSVFAPGRLVFCGKPTVEGEGLSVRSQTIEILAGSSDSLDTALTVIPDDDQKLKILSRKAGAEMTLNRTKDSILQSVQDLTLETEIELADGTISTMQNLVRAGLTEKIRCQTPFRASSSCAAFIYKGKDGTPFVYDSGTGITHWPVDKQEFVLIAAYEKAEEVVRKAQADSGVAFEEDSIAALARVKKINHADFERYRSKLKRAKVSVTKLDMAVKELEKVTQGETAASTHHEFALDIIQNQTVGTSIPVSHHGDLYVLNPENKIWIKKPSEEIIRLVADRHDGHELCRRSSDYNSISKHVIIIANRKKFFETAPVGVATPEGFYSIEGADIKVEPLNPEHRQRLILDFAPKGMETPLFDSFLQETFEAKDPDETRQQIGLLQEIFGAVMLGLMPRHHKAVLFYDRYGRAGKGVTERILRRLVPAEFVTAVSPFKWNHDYHIASLVGMRLNVVGELPEGETIPAANFKTVIGGDMLNGRPIYKEPVTFTNEAAHIFMSNHLISTKDQSEAFFARWLLLEFPNSRLKSGKPVDTGLPVRIIADEMPGIAFWALEGAKRLLDNGKFSESVVHNRLVERWRNNANSLFEFISECCIKGEYVRRSNFYESYKTWCGENTRKSFAKGRVKELLENNISLGIRLGNQDGYEVFRGINVKVEETKSPAGHNRNWQK